MGEEGFLTYIATNNQGAMEIIGFHFREPSCRPSFLTLSFILKLFQKLSENKFVPNKQAGGTCDLVGDYFLLRMNPCHVESFLETRWFFASSIVKKRKFRCVTESQSGTTSRKVWCATPDTRWSSLMILCLLLEARKDRITAAPHETWSATAQLQEGELQVTPRKHRKRNKRFKNQFLLHP